MSDRRRRNRRNREEKTTPILAKREDGSNEGTARILLKTKTYEPAKNESSSKTSDFKDPNDGAEYESDEAAPKLTEPYTLLTTRLGIERNNIKDYLRNHSDFLVVGVIGMQGVGKSTILNLLNGEKRDSNLFQKLFVEKKGVFSMEFKEKRTCSHSRTENMELYITENRVILIDSPPVLANIHGRNPIDSNILNLHSMVTFLSVCHLVIIVWDDSFNLNFMRLLMFAFQLKNKNDAKSSFGGLLPNILFVKNKAKREDFKPDALDRLYRILKSFFGDILFDKVEEQKSGESHRSKRAHSKNSNRSSVHAFIFPHVKGFDDISCRQSLDEIVDDLRTLVFLTPRKGLGPPGEAFTELTWLEHFNRTIYDVSTDCLLETYENVYKQNFKKENCPGELSTETETNATDSVKDAEPSEQAWAEA